MYPVLKSAIDIAIDEIISKKEKERRASETSSHLAHLASKYGKKEAEASI
jgi:hypothetical protein